MFENYELIWLTGQPGFGKTVIGNHIHHFLNNTSSRKSVIIDGDDIRALFENQDSSVNFGRGVGYDIIEYLVPEDISSISATKVREQMRKEGKL
jgi:tRNA uridine 5-carbamoylmethylation protein Kti12